MQENDKTCRHDSSVNSLYTPALYFAKLMVMKLTLYGPNSFFRRFCEHNLRWALFVYRLIDATLI